MRSTEIHGRDVRSGIHTVRGWEMLCGILDHLGWAVRKGWGAVVQEVLSYGRLQEKLWRAG